jgi:hypothetical protein
MRIMSGLCLALVAVVVALPAAADLQNIEVGGSIMIRGVYYRNGYVINAVDQFFSPGFFAPANPATPWIGSGGRVVRWFGPSIPYRPIGNPFINPAMPPGTFNTDVFSWYDWDSRGPNLKYVKQRTRLHAKADFTNDVKAFIELDSFDIWGEDFRSNYLTGADSRASHFTANTALGHAEGDVEIYQSYIEANDMFGHPLRLRIGRQELSFGSEWLVGVNEPNYYAEGLSFDAVRLTYAPGMFSVDAWWSKLTERSPLEEDGDVDFYGVYASYLGIPDITIDAYWMLVRDARQLFDSDDATNPLYYNVLEWLFGVDDYSVTYLHTIGLRAAGVWGPIDFEAEVAYQFGNADQVGWLFTPYTAGPHPLFPNLFVQSFYGDNKAKWDSWAANLEIGYTFDTMWSPRAFVGLAYFEGEDNRGIDFFEWLGAMLNPFHRPTASVSFNRLFSNWNYSDILDSTNLSNFWMARVGVGAMPTEKVQFLVRLSYFESVESFEQPYNFWLNRTRIVPLWFLPWLTTSVDKELGWELGAYVSYAYSEDLTFELGWMHLFVGDGLKHGNFGDSHGLGFLGGTSGDDADYIYLETRISF